MKIPYMNKQRAMLIGGGFVMILSIVLVFIFGTHKCGSFKNPPELELLVWGVFDDVEVFEPFFEEFKNSYSVVCQDDGKTYKKAAVKIRYKKIPVDSYESELTNALAESRGPDLFMIHNTWVDKHFNKLAPIPSGPLYDRPRDFLGRLDQLINVTPAAFGETFVDAASQDLIRDGKIYSLPLYVDTLGLFYNKQMFNSSGIPETAVTWNQFIDQVIKLTKFTSKGAIARSGVAMGSADNVNRAPDILSLLMMQNGTPMTDPEKDHKVTFDRQIVVNDERIKPGETALQFYTSFTDPREEVYTWDARAPHSIDAFVQGDAAMMFNYSYTIPALKRKAPYLDFGVAPMPQTQRAIDDNNEPLVNFATYWTFGVSKQSGLKNSRGELRCAWPQQISKCEVAWDFLLYMADSKRTSRYLEATRRPTARRDLVNTQRSDVELGNFALQSLTARTWRQPDNGVVDQVFSDMIKGVNLNNQSTREALEASAQQLNLLIRGE